MYNWLLFRTRSTTTKLTNAWKIKKDIICEIEKFGEMLMLQFISGRLISFCNLFIYVNNSQYTFKKQNIYILLIKTKYIVCFKTLILNQIQFQFQS